MVVVDVAAVGDVAAVVVWHKWFKYSLHGWRDMIIEIPCRRRGGQGRSVVRTDELFEHGHGVSGSFFSGLGL